MRSLNFISVKLSICLILGIVLGYHLEPDIHVLGGFLVLTTIFLFVALKKALPWFEVLAVSLTIALGAYIAGLANPKSHGLYYGHQDITQTNTYHLKIREVRKATLQSHNYRATVQQVNTKVTQGDLLFRIRRDSLTKPLKVDDELVVLGEVKEIRAPLNPHQFNFKEYARTLGIFHQLTVTNTEIVTIKQGTFTLSGAALNFRTFLISKLKKAPFGKKEASIIQALLLGERNEIAPETYDSYKNAGAVHILALSGLHIGILLLLLQFLLTPLEKIPKGKQLKLIVVLIILWLFAFIAGLSPSIVRAVTMFSFISYAIYLNRPTNTFNIIALSLFFILLVRPLFLFQVGFQMSYAAVFSIVWIYPKLQGFWWPKSWLIQKPWQLLCVSFAAQLGVLPLSLYYFHQFPSLFFISNLLIVPFLGLLLGMGILVITLAAVNKLPNLLAIVYNKAIQAMNAIIEWIAGFESFVFQDITFDGVQLLMSYTAILFLIPALTKRTFRPIILFLGTVLLFQGYAIYRRSNLDEHEDLILMHRTANTIMLHHIGSVLDVYGKTTGNLGNLVSDYRVAHSIDSITYKELSNSYRFNGISLFIVDSLGLYSENLPHDLILLTQSPKINLERALEVLRPKMVLIDGSNYKSDVARWKTTCRKKGIPFHYTGEKGAYFFD